MSPGSQNKNTNFSYYTEFLDYSIYPGSCARREVGNRHSRHLSLSLLLMMIQSLTSIFNYQPQTKAEAFPFVARLSIDTNVDKREKKEDAAGSKMQWMDEIYIINRQTSNNVYTRSSSSSSDTDPNG
jgi:hypothetical protein